MTGLASRALERILEAMLRFVDWLYGPKGAGFDLALGLVAGGWGVLLITKPHLFDQGQLAFIGWLSDRLWLVLMMAAALGHLGGLIWPHRLGLRAVAALVSAWAWLFVAGSTARGGIGTAALVYGVLGLGALTASIYVMGLGRYGGRS